MSCTQFDLKGYLLGELAQSERREVDEHLEQCPACGEELDRLRLTQAALLSLREEEVPRRVAFVSDKVFEPSWWQRLWASGPRLGFAGAAILSLAILVHAFVQPAATPAPAPPDTAAIERRISDEVARRIQQAMAESETRQARRMEQAVLAARREMEFQRAADRTAVEAAFTLLEKKMNVRYLASADFGGRP